MIKRNEVFIVSRENVSISYWQQSLSFVVSHRTSEAVIIKGTATQFASPLEMDEMRLARSHGSRPDDPVCSLHNYTPSKPILLQMDRGLFTSTTKPLYSISVTQAPSSLIRFNETWTRIFEDQKKIVPDNLIPLTRIIFSIVLQKQH